MENDPLRSVYFQNMPRDDLPFASLYTAQVTDYLEKSVGKNAIDEVKFDNTKIVGMITWYYVQNWWYIKWSHKIIPSDWMSFILLENLLGKRDFYFLVTFPCTNEPSTNVVRLSCVYTFKWNLPIYFFWLTHCSLTICPFVQPGLWYFALYGCRHPCLLTEGLL